MTSTMPTDLCTSEHHDVRVWGYTVAHVMYAEVDHDAPAERWVVTATVVTSAGARVGTIVRTDDGYAVTGVRVAGEPVTRHLPGADSLTARHELVRQFLVRRDSTDRLAELFALVAPDPAASAALSSAVAYVASLPTPATGRPAPAPAEVQAELDRLLAPARDYLAGIPGTPERPAPAQRLASMASFAASFIVNPVMAEGMPYAAEGVGDAYNLASRGNCGPNYRPDFYR